MHCFMQHGTTEWVSQLVNDSQALVIRYSTSQPIKNFLFVNVEEKLCLDSIWYIERIIERIMYVSMLRLLQVMKRINNFPYFFNRENNSNEMGRVNPFSAVILLIEKSNIKFNTVISIYRLHILHSNMSMLICCN